MKSALRMMLTSALLLVPVAAIADGPPGEYGPGYGPGDYPPGSPQDPNAPSAPYYGDPNAGYAQPTDPNQQGIYQPPPEGVCVDENNQPQDCTQDADYASYNQVEDGFDGEAHQDFRDALSPYGSWVSTAEYGQVWIPSTAVVGADFTPYYSGGRWNYTDYGWTWVSDYSWGWAPFHYGRWHVIGNYGWCWIPGRIWGPAWVHWRMGGGYVGWAPLPPRGIRIAAPMLGARWHHWNFIPMNQIGAPRLVRVGLPLLPTLYSRTVLASEYRAIGSTRIVFGPSTRHFASASINIVPTPLNSLHVALPRSHIVVRPSLPLHTRTYYAPVVQRAPAAWRTGPGWQQPAPGVYGRPGYPAPGYQRPYQPAPSPGWQQRPWQPAPGQVQQPPYQAPGWQRPTHPAPGWQQPAQTPPGWQRPTHPAPGWQHAPGQGPIDQAPPTQPMPPMQQTPPIHQAPPMRQMPPMQQMPPMHQAPPMRQAPPVQPMPPSHHVPPPVQHMPPAQHMPPVHHAPPMQSAPRPPSSMPHGSHTAPPPFRSR